MYIVLSRVRLLSAVLAAILLLSAGPTLRGADKRIVLIAGKPSHPPGMHEFRAGTMLMQKALAGVPGLKVDVYTNGWPSKAGSDGAPVDDNDALNGADAVLIYADGGGGHPAIQRDHMQVIDALAKKGVGLGFAHYAVEVPAGAPGEAMQQWMGGYYETNFSVNPMWDPKFEILPDHPITRGVKPFSNHDEWYAKKRITPILTDKPSDEVRKGPYVSPRGPYDHIIADSGKVETMMWTFERPDGGRSFGFTGGHTHTNWGDPNQRKVVLNALLWIAKIDVPKNGVEDTITPEDLTVNLDPKGGRR